MEGELLQCYNRGCGQKFKADDNNDDTCCHHPGAPVFHDAYKGWSCCNKKCTDFTEFLNIKGCTLSKHSNVKPPEPQKPVVEAPIPDTNITKPTRPTQAIKRPPYNTPLISMTPIIAQSLKQQIVSDTTMSKIKQDGAEIAIGTICKNSGCNKSYEGPESDGGPCLHHPGSPIFHEGLKYWSCCQKRTTDFNVFLNQVGCVTGKHVWKKESDDSKSVDCRWDFHQTGTHVIISIYAKQYCPYSSVVKLNPIRLFATVVFPQQSNATFVKDIELCGIVDVNESVVNMYGSKIEIKLRKAEPGSWKNVDVPRRNGTQETKPSANDLSPKVEAVDLSDL